MLEIGIHIDVATERYYQHWYANSCQKGDVVMLISYAGRTPQMAELVKVLKKKEVTMILISSMIEIDFAKDVDYHLYFSPYEDSEEKIASFSSRVSLQYLLDCIYASYFNRDYEKNLEERFAHYIE
ncbi:SIS domain-containing protein [Allocoprobacillus halotolerans]|uniref:SIS domain-containing protein n=1 Tax=Allocoprobacillus halotolerans TaxID=2944914 RepID=A0ABY5I6R9_9FIRM|nr:SIS domain-containing protein [Allocoprobacillus halotolerans]UTY40705.1 SIS domain-containing protein [Allocoprobacillus halotolerans]